MSPVSDIKLIRTDTTLDLSQKAEKGMPSITIARVFMQLLVPCQPCPAATANIKHARSCAAGCQLLRCAAALLTEVAFDYRLWETAEREESGSFNDPETVIVYVAVIRIPISELFAELFPDRCEKHRLNLRHQLLLSVAMTIALPTYKYPRMADIC